MRATKTVVRTEADALRLRAERAEESLLAERERADLAEGKVRALRDHLGEVERASNVLHNAAEVVRSEALRGTIGPETIGALRRAQEAWVAVFAADAPTLPPSPAVADRMAAPVPEWVGDVSKGEGNG